jgi:hypothetical protein
MDGKLSKEEAQVQFDAVRERARNLGVLDINFARANSSPDALKCYNYTLDVIEKNKAVLYQNAGETEV